MVTDHSDNMGFFPDLFAGKPEVLADPMGRRWYDMIQSGKGRRSHRDHRGLFAGKWPKKLEYVPGRHPTGRPGGRRSRQPTRPMIRAASRRSSV